MSALDDAVARQNEASTPFQSSWVSANAGSGKTRVLTDRVARLLLRGVDPQRILCLTYTKAAASEMQGRLFKRLGEWAMMPDQDLATALGEIGEDVAPSDLTQARTLFARALETPGGLKIQTIHAFCGNVLRRFPLEAGVSPQFKELDDVASKNLMDRVIEDMAEEGANGPFAKLAPFLNDGDAARNLAYQCLNEREALARFDAGAAAHALGVNVDDTEAAIKARALAAIDLGEVRDIFGAISAHGSEPNKKLVKGLGAIGLETKRDGLFPTLAATFLTKEKKPRSTSGFPVKKVEEMVPGVKDAVVDVVDRMGQAMAEVNALQSYQRSCAAAAFGADFVARYEARKREMTALDFSDLIELVARLLESPDRARWVQYRIDGSIDHILVDEAQDTSPRQWDIVEALEAEFTDAAPSEDAPRTLFVVGDPKQSIFGFQGADVAGFNDKQHRFDERLQTVGRKMHSVGLEHSFRSAGPILELVDAVFQDSAGIGEASKHKWFSDKPGRVDLWPFIKGSNNPKEDDRYLAKAKDAPDKAARKLARHVAGFVADELAKGRMIPDLSDKTVEKWRQLTPGDIMILVRSRSTFFHAVINELKRANVPVAGADKMKLLDVLAVQDVLSLLKFLDHQGDDLALAEALRSPLFEVTEQELYTAAHNRDGTLWQALRQSDAHDGVVARLGALRNALDFKRPYELLEMILTEQGGRKRLNARLGPETDEALDELLALALNFEQQQSPSLTNFIAWIAASEVEVKRQMDNVNAALRVMTVHGAKGLEAPMVIVPHLDVRTNAANNQVLSDDKRTYLSSSSSKTDPAELEDLREEQTQKETEEAERLLYVALTRAESWLVVCGAARGEKGWYESVLAGMKKLPGTQATAVPFVAADEDLESVQTLTSDDWFDKFSQEGGDAQGGDDIALPDWADTKPAPEAAGVAAINPSKLGGAHALPGAEGDEAEAAMRRGDMIHQLLDVLPRAPRETRAAWGKTIVKEAPEGAALIAQAMALIERPELAYVFGPDALAEAEIAADCARAGGKIIGRADRIIITANRVECIDFKSNRQVPDTASGVPLGLLQQMGAYRAALGAVWPQKEIVTKILWTETGALMALPNDLVDGAFEGAI